MKMLDCMSLDVSRETIRGLVVALRDSVEKFLILGISGIMVWEIDEFFRLLSTLAPNSNVSQFGDGTG